MPINTKCPTCKRTVEIPDELMGKKVRCPSCKVVFLATAGGSAPPTKTESSRPQPPKPKSEEGIRVRRKPPLPSEEEDEDEDEEEETPRVRKKGVRRREEDEEEEDEEEEAEAEEEEKEEYLPRRKRRRFRRDMAPHRAGTILTLGILSLVCLPIIFGPMAWTMGNNDLKEMDAGRMDPSGEGMTKAGKICGIISTALMIVSCVGWLLMLGYSLVRIRMQEQ
jgi:hypothetical protein